MNESMYLVDDLYSENIEREPLRTGFGRGLVEAGKQDERVWALCADLTGSTKMDGFAEQFPDRFVEMGIAEQNMASVGSGLAAMGKVPFITSYAMFNPGRNWEQIRTSLGLNESNVKVIGSHAGVSVGPDGATHQALEDIATTRVIPNMMVIAPADSVEAEKATIAIANYEGPVYMRLAREGTPVFTTDRTPFDLTRAYVMREGTDVSLIVTGTMTYQSLVAANLLNNEGISAEVVHVPVIKPMDTVTVLASIEKTGAVVTAEEAQVIGGLGGAIAELVAENKPVPMRRVGVNDRFGESGDPDELLEKFNLTGRDIAEKAKEVLNSK